MIRITFTLNFILIWSIVSYHSLLLRISFILILVATNESEILDLFINNGNRKEKYKLSTKMNFAKFSMEKFVLALKKMSLIYRAT